MTHGIYTAASAMDAASKRLDSISHNLANVSTPTFKRTSTAFRSIQVGRPGSDQRVLSRFEVSDLSQGPLQFTGNTLDVALDGEGFFAVDDGNGEVYLRGGSFQIDQAGTLVDAKGRPLAWETLAGALDPVGEPITIDAEGAVSQGAAERGRLRIANFSDPRRLRLDADGYLEAPAGLKEVAHEASVHQGALEGSNVNAMEEIVALIEVQRSFESAANAMSMIEQSYRRLNRSQ